MPNQYHNLGWLLITLSNYIFSNYETGFHSFWVYPSLDYLKQLQDLPINICKKGQYYPA